MLMSETGPAADMYSQQEQRLLWVKSAVLTIGRLLPVSLAKRTFSETVSNVSNVP